jgi:hypothetical protein
MIVGSVAIHVCSQTQLVCCVHLLEFKQPVALHILDMCNAQICLLQVIYKTSSLEVFLKLGLGYPFPIG